VLKLIKGNLGKRALNKREPLPTTGNLKTAPDWFDQDQLSAWNYAVDHAPRGMLKKIDASTLVVWVVAESLHRKAALAIAKFGMVTLSPVKKEPMQNPYLAILNRQALILLRASAELGFSPSARSRVSLEPGAGENEGKGKSAFSEFRRNA
jgi:P27 family predicted phage terminase small subunit